MTIQEFRKLKNQLKVAPSMEKELKQIATSKSAVAPAKAAVKKAETELKAVPEE